MVVKRGRSVTVGSDPILCFSPSILNPVRVFSMAFTSSAFAVTFAFVFNNVTSLFSFLTSTSLLSLLISLFEFSVSYWLQLSLSLLLFEKWFSPRGDIVCFGISFSVAVVFKEHIGGDCPGDQSHNWVFLELF